MIKKILCMSLFSSIVLAKAYYAPKSEMIKEADAIAIVNILDTRSEKNQGEHYWYAKVATAEPEKTLKGQLPSKFEIYWDEDFICAKCKLVKGKHLVFLRKQGVQKWACSNWYLSVRNIEKDEVEWYKDNSSTTLSLQALESVLKDIQLELVHLKN